MGMTITAPSSPVVVTEVDLINPEADKDPLKTILENANHAYQHFAPPLLSAVYTVTSGLTRNAVFQVPVAPSRDDLTYRFEHHMRSGSGANNMGVTVEEWTGAAWNTIHTTTTIAAAANSWVEYSHTAVIVSTATKLRLTYSRAASDPHTPHSVHVTPQPTTLSAGTKASGFNPTDDGLITAAGAPITVEHVNRSPQNAHHIVRDRRQCVASFVQEDASTPSNVLHDVGNATHAAVGQRILYGRAIATFPFQSAVSVDVYCIATHDHTSGSNLVYFGAAEGDEASFNADGTVETATVVATCSRKGLVDAGVEFILQGDIPASGKTTYIHAVVAYWRPGD